MHRSTVSLVYLAMAAVGCQPAPPADAGAERHSPPPHTVASFSIQLPEMTLAPGREFQPCYLFDVPAGLPSRWVGGGVLRTGPGLHHGNITTRARTGEGSRTCPRGASAEELGVEVANGGTVLFGSSTQIEGDEWRRFPAGMAFRLPDDQEIVARMHYLNASAQPVTVAPRYEWFVIDAAEVGQEIAPFAWSYMKFQLPALQETTLSSTCTFPAAMNVVEVLPHMHEKGKRFTAAYLGGPLDGRLFLDSPGYDPANGVLVSYDPPIDLWQGDGVTFACTWYNPLDQAVREGVGVNEMCILFGYAWPPEQAYTTATYDGQKCIVVGAPGP